MNNQLNGRTGKSVLVAGRDNSLAKTGEIKGYSWFNQENKDEAFSSLSAMVHARHNNIPSQARLHYKDAVAHYNKDRAEHSLARTRVMDYPTKLFAVHEFDDDPVPFTVKSTKFDWEVLPIDLTRERTPLAVLERVTQLKRAGIEFDHYAMAVPGEANHVPAQYVAREQVQRTLQDIARLGRRIIRSARAVGAAAASAARPVVVSAEAMNRFLKDPVLLGCYGFSPCYLIEIGRWD